MRFSLIHGRPVVESGGVAVIRLYREDGSTAVALDCGGIEQTAAFGSCRIAGHLLEVCCGSSRWDVRDRYSIIRDGIIAAERTWTYRGSEGCGASPLFELYASRTPTWFLVPSVSYNGNHEGTGKEPKGLTMNGDAWWFSYERESLPSATFSEDSRHCVGLFASDTSRESLVSSCSLLETPEGMAHRICWPIRESPLCYRDTDQYEPALVQIMDFLPGGTFAATFYLFVAEIREPRTGWFRAFDAALELFPGLSARRFSTGEVWDLGIRFIKESLWVDEGPFHGFSIGLLPEGRHIPGRPGARWMQRRYRRYEIGWAGQNLSNALLLLHDGAMNGSADSLDKGIRCIDSWQQNVVLPNGLFHVLFDDLLDGRADPVVDTCNLGWGAMQVVRAYRFARALGHEKPGWLSMGTRCCDFFVERWRERGAFGKMWTLDGQCREEGGTIGAFMIPALVEAFRATGDTRYLETARASFSFYAGRDLERMVCTSGALDTDCIDCETAFALLDPALDLTELTGESWFLEMARMAAYYVMSWVYHYDVAADPGSEFERYGFKTRGSSAVSTQHHHLHYAGLYFVRDFIRLGRALGDPRWAYRARLIWRSSLQMISDGSLEIHGMRRPPGSEAEAYFPSRWGAGTNGGAKHSINDWLVIWPVTFRLLNLIGEDAELVRETLDGEEPLA